MVYKIGNPKDIISIPNLSDAETKVISKFANILSDMYGIDRDVDNDYGGYILFASKGTNHKEIKEYFDYDANIIEYAEFYEPDICSAVYITSTEYGVVLIMSLDDTPVVIRHEIEKTMHKLKKFEEEEK